MKSTSNEALERIELHILRGLVKLLPERQDSDPFELILEHCEQKRKPLLIAARDLNVLTPKVWIFYLIRLLMRWDVQSIRESIAPTLIFRSELRRGRSKKEADLLDPLIDSVLNALSLIVRIRDNSSFFYAEKFFSVLLISAQFFQRCGASDEAYDVALAALDMSPPQGADTEKLAKFALANASFARRTHQILICKAVLAAAVVESSLRDDKRRVEAFELVEEVIEGLSLVSQQIRMMALQTLLPVMKTKDYMKVLALKFASFAPEELRGSVSDKFLENGLWLSRIHTNIPDGWGMNIANHAAAEFERNMIESARMRLEPPTSELANSDWLNWTFQLPAYLDAVPINQSIMRETNFNEQFMLLVHESTHVLSFMGAIGIALSALRVALAENEYILWSNVAEADDVAHRISVEGVVTLENGDAFSLLRVERRLDLIEKARILQDLWLPWMEGLAIFSECAADPQLDVDRISPVIQTLRGLIDIFPSQNSLDEERRKIEAIHVTFEKKCHAALDQLGFSRFSAYMRRPGHPPYFQGYLIVRSVISSWERVLGRKLNGPEAFLLLLHATRHSTLAALPDLSIATKNFTDAAVNGFIAWIRMITSVPKLDIEKFLLPPPRDGDSPAYFWQDGRLLPQEGDLSTYVEFESGIRTRLLNEAFSSLIDGPITDDDPYSNDRSNEILPAFLQLFSEKMQERGAVTPAFKVIYNDLIETGTLLPIGSARSRFYLGFPDDESNAQLVFVLRTTEEHEETGKASGTQLVLSLPVEAANGLREEYAKILSPYLRITRCADIGGVLDEQSNGEWHIFVLSYGDWTHIFGASPFIQRVLNADEDKQDMLKSMLRFRTNPTPFQLAERTLIAPGDLAVQRSADWLNSSTQWHFNGSSVNLDAWVARVRATNMRLLQQDRGTRQLDIAEILLAKIWNDPAAAQLVRHGFDSLSQNSPGFRKALLKWMYDTGRGGNDYPLAPQLAEVIKKFGTSFTAMTPFGWAIRPVAL